MSLQSLRTKAPSLASRTQVRTVYIPPGGKSILDRRLPRKLKVGETRPPIYYKFDCKVELSDGSTYTRRSQFPKVEWRYLADHRNNPRWNPTRANLQAADAEMSGAVAKFQKKYGMSLGETDAEDKTKKPEKAAASEAKEEKVPEKSSESLLSDDFDDLMGEGFVPVQAGGRLQNKRRGKK